MALPVAWSPEALDDVEAIATFIDRDSPSYAAAVVHRMVSLASTLGGYPEAGRIVPELADPAIREHFVHEWRLIYRIEPTRVLVVAVVHGRRQFDPGERFGA
jgi:plasmid stabilization system protein ParE